ncbi:MAG: diol dehydratase small subunit [Bryobacterales bacterium]|nr:diol dehydratase small subunit [Bryobacteraceae bacterium]MDW8355848.1 diol dehydratase small subunit [Bryobacterales bacterium]
MNEDYPLAEKHPDQLRTPTGRPFAAITLHAAVAGEIGMEDLRITPEALEWQARIAESEGRTQLAENLRRAAELTRLPDERILEIYEALRPGRSDKAALERLADELERDYGAFRCARLLRDAAV